MALIKFPLKVAPRQFKRSANATQKNKIESKIVNGLGREIDTFCSTSKPQKNSTPPSKPCNIVPEDVEFYLKDGFSHLSDFANKNFLFKPQKK